MMPLKEEKKFKCKEPESLNLAGKPAGMAVRHKPVAGKIPQPAKPSAVKFPVGAIPGAKSSKNQKTYMDVENAHVAPPRERDLSEFEKRIYSKAEEPVKK